MGVTDLTGETVTRKEGLPLERFVTS